MVAEVERWERSLRKGFTRLAVLELLAADDDYGYGLLAKLEEAPGPWSTTEATVYPLLHDLEERGFLEADWRAVEEGVPPRKYYSLTPLGAELLSALRERWARAREALEDLVVPSDDPGGG